MITATQSRTVGLTKVRLSKTEIIFTQSDILFSSHSCSHANFKQGKFYRLLFCSVFNHRHGFQQPRMLQQDLCEWIMFDLKNLLLHRNIISAKPQPGVRSHCITHCITHCKCTVLPFWFFLWKKTYQAEIFYFTYCFLGNINLQTNKAENMLGHLPVKQLIKSCDNHCFRSWTQWSLWVPSSLKYPLILCFNLRSSECPCSPCKSGYLHICDVFQGLFCEHPAEHFSKTWRELPPSDMSCFFSFLFEFLLSNPSILWVRCSMRCVGQYRKPG